MKKILISILLLLSQLSFSQKNSLWLGLSFTKAEQESLTFNQPSFKKINTFGNGFTLLLEHNIKKSETSFFKIGGELSSVRQGFYLNGFSNYLYNTSFKLPALYCFKLKLSKRTLIVFDLGTKLQFLFDTQTTSFVWNNSTQLIIKTKSGLFPLINFNFGTEVSLKQKRVIGITIGVNKGFVNYEKIIYKSF